MFHLGRRVAYGVAIGGVVLAMAAGTVLAGHDTGVASAGARSTSATSAMDVIAARAGAGHGAGFVRGGPSSGFGHLGARAGRLLKVTGVSGNTISATTERGNRAITVDVTGATTYTRAGQSASLSDVAAGEIIAVRGQANPTTLTIQATAVTIVLPSTRGVVTAINGNTLTLTDLNAIPRTVTLNGSTTYKRGTQSAGQPDVAVGSLIAVQGTLNSDGSLTAVLVSIQLPHLAGTVSGLQSGQFTLTTPDGTAYTVQTTAQTTYTQPGYGTATAAALKNTGQVRVEGTLSSDGKTLTATSIVIMPSLGAAPGPNSGPGQTTGTGANA